MKKEKAVKSTTKLNCAGRTVYGINYNGSEGVSVWTPAGKRTGVPAIFAREDLANEAIEARAMEEYNYLISEGEDVAYATAEADYIRNNYIVTKHEIFRAVTIPKKKRAKARPAGAARVNYW